MFPLGVDNHIFLINYKNLFQHNIFPIKMIVRTKNENERTRFNLFHTKRIILRKEQR